MRIVGAATVLAALLTMSCHGKPNPGGAVQTVQTASPVGPADASPVGPAAADSPAAQVGEGLRSVNFKNFTYPVCANLKPHTLPRSKQVTLNGGELEVERGAEGNSDPVLISLGDVSFRDLTRDGDEEAIVTLTALLFPHGSNQCTYVYSWRQGQPKLLWSYAFGTDAFGGLRRLGVEDGNLVIESYQSSNSAAYCCPEKFVRSHFTWNGKTFKETGSEVFINESQQNQFLGYPGSAALPPK